MFSIRIITLSLMIPAFSFAGTAAAQNVGQLELCALEVRSASAEGTANAQVQAEENPLKRAELGHAAAKIANEAYRARLDFFGAKDGVRNTGKIDYILGSRPFAGFTGKITRLLAQAEPGTFSLSFSLSAVLDCPHQGRSVVLAAQFANPATDQWISDLIALREALQQIKVGSVVEFSGRIFVMAHPRSPVLGTEATVYWMKVTALKNGLSGATQGAATRPQ